MARTDSGFKTPFSDVTKRNPEANPGRLTSNGKRSCEPRSRPRCRRVLRAEVASLTASPNATSHHGIVLIPDQYTKNLPASLRRKAVESFDKHLLRATLANQGGDRTGSQEAEIWGALGLPATEARVRREVVLRAALEIEVRRSLVQCRGRG